MKLHHLHGPLVTLHVLGLVFCVTITNSYTYPLTEIAQKYRLEYLRTAINVTDCKGPQIRFEEPCRCYRLRNNLTVLDCNDVAFRFFPPMPQGVLLYLASFRNVGYQGLPTELFRNHKSELCALDLSYNFFLALTTSSFDGLETSLEYLNLSHNSLGRNFQPLLEMPELRKLQSLRVLDISSNGIKMMTENTFDNMKTLEELYLANNDLTDILFLQSAKLPGLVHLELSGNRLFRLESNSFSAMPSLRSLSLMRNFVTLILPGAFNGTSLRKISLRGNRMQGVEMSAFVGAERSLVNLDLSFNGLRRMPDLQNLLSVRILNLSSNMIGDFSALTILPSSIEDLDLSGNQLTATTLNKRLTLLTGLKSLNLARNFLGDGISITETTANFSQLQHLDLSSTNLSTTPTNLLQQLPSLQTLDLSYNVLTTVPATALSGVSANLQSIAFRNCKISQIHPDTFVNFPNLQQLDLSSNFVVDSFESVASKLPKSLKWLNLSRNKLSRLPEVHDSLPNLEYFDIGGNQLVEVNLQLLPMQSLKFLNLSNNLVREFPVLLNVETKHKDFTGTLRLMASSDDMLNPLRGTWSSSVETLDLSGNKIERVNQGITGFGNLTHLSLARNLISSLPTEFLADLATLRWIDFSENNISTIANKTFSNLPRLIELDLSKNKLKVFPVNAFWQLSKLENFRLENNLLVLFSENASLQHFPSLRFLSLSKNEFTEFPADTFFNTSIEKLDLSGNHLVAIVNTTLRQMKNLRSLWLNGNRITGIDAGVFHTVPQLQNLDLSNNAVSYMSENAFRGVRRLSLNLANNALQQIFPETFMKQRIDRLESLNIANNKFKSFPDRALMDQEFNLVSLNLSGNKIPDIPIGSLINAKVVDVSFNPLSPASIITLLSDPKTTFQLNMAGVGLTVFPPLQLQFLTHLNLSGNNLTGFGDPANWDHGVLLEQLDLSDNQIESLRDSKLSFILPKLGFLKSLRLSGNPIKHIRENNLGGMVNVNNLDLSNLLRLETFDISNLLQFPRLENLKASGYPRLSNFPVGDLSYQIPLLRHLDVELKYTILTDQLQGFFWPSMESLTLSGLPLTRISRDALASLNPANISVILRNLSLHGLSAEVFQRFPRSADVVLGVYGTKMAGNDIAGLMQNFPVADAKFQFSDNKLNCSSCEMSSLLSVFGSLKNQASTLICDIPADFAGKSVFVVTTSNSSCTTANSQLEVPLATTKPIGSSDERSRGASLKRSKALQKQDDNVQPSTDALDEPDVIFEVTTARPIAAVTSYQMEGTIAGIIVGLLLLTGIIITAIICWYRRDKRRHEKYIDGAINEKQYAVMPNPDIMAHPTWFPPPQPVFVVPLQAVPMMTTFSDPDRSMTSVIDYRSDASLRDYQFAHNPLDRQIFYQEQEAELPMDGDSDYAHSYPYSDQESRVSYSDMTSYGTDLDTDRRTTSYKNPDGSYRFLS